MKKQPKVKPVRLMTKKEKALHVLNRIADKNHGEFAEMPRHLRRKQTKLLKVAGSR